MADNDKRVKGFADDSFGFGSSDHPEYKPLPFRIMAVGDFCGANRSAAREPAAIDAHDFDKVLERFWPRAVFEVENHLGTSGKTLEIDFTPTTLKDFEPRVMAARIPALQPVADFITRAKQLADGSLKPADFKKDLAPIQAIPALRDALEAVLDKIGGAPPASSPSLDTKGKGDASVDAIFDMVDTGKKDSGGSAIDAFAGGISGGGTGFDVSDAISAAGELLENQLRAVYDHAGIQRLERNWRGLHLLCKRGKGARIEVFDGDYEAWKTQVFDAELAGTSDAPLAMVLVAEEVDNTPAGLELLQQWGDYGAQIQCAVVFDATKLVGIEMSELSAKDAPANVFEDSRFDKWRSLRDKDESRWLCAALNPWFMRPELTRKRHNAEGPVAWGSPVWLVGASVAQSMQRTGWPASHTGAANGEIEQLKVYPHSDGAEYPLQAIFSDRALKDLSRAGFTPLICQPNNDSAWVILAPMLHKPSKAEEEGKLGTLAYQLVASRLGETLISHKARLVVQGDANASAQNLAKFVAGLLADTGAGANIDIQGDENQLVLNIRTGKDLLGGVELQLGIKL
ncbi:MAG: type VI secretion system contractile sheath large subunit [Planctomycetes bacterium]|nr:type VI secretion system contractile sheath large subunit [Planctomycetota bacterium]